MAYSIPTAVYVEVNGVPLHTTGWSTVNPMAIAGGFATRGSSRLIPGAAGVLPGRRRTAPRQVTLQLIVNGARDGEGAAHTNRSGGVRANLDHIADNVRSADGEPVTATLHYLNAAGAPATKTGLVHAETLEEGDDTGIGSVRATLTLFIPAGGLS